MQITSIACITLKVKALTYEEDLGAGKLLSSMVQSERLGQVLMKQ